MKIASPLPLLVAAASTLASMRYAPCTASYSAAVAKRSFWMRVTYRTSVSASVPTRSVVSTSGVPVAWTGTAVGLVSLVGYTPDVFFGPVMGHILDTHPGVTGHQYLFTMLAAVAVVGAVTAGVFGWVVRRRGAAATPS